MPPGKGWLGVCDLDDAVCCDQPSSLPRYWHDSKNTEISVTQADADPALRLDDMNHVMPCNNALHRQIQAPSIYCPPYLSVILYYSCYAV